MALESTSVYWIPVYETLDRAGFEVILDPSRGAFRSGDKVCPLPSYAR